MSQSKDHDDNYEAVFEPPRDTLEAAHARECAERAAINIAQQITEARATKDWEAEQRLRAAAAKNLQDYKNEREHPHAPLFKFSPLVLKSDFRDFYDVMLDREGEVFDRRTTSGPNRMRMFELFIKHGLTTPRHGTVASLHAHLPSRSPVVVHHDPMAHCGEGKEMMPLGTALAQYPRTFAVEYITPPNGLAISYRLLWLGRWWFLLRYSSTTDWRSNVGEGDVELLESMAHIPTDMWPTLLIRQELKAPLMAVDFVRGHDRRNYAIDLNIAPQLRGTGIERVITPTEVVVNLKQWLAVNG